MSKRPRDSIPAPSSEVVDVFKRHEERMNELEHRRDVELPAMREQLEQFRLVLRDEAKLTDAMANAVFKDHALLRNARLKERARRKQQKGDPNADPEHFVTEEAYNDIQAGAKEHSNYLRRLKGKSASKLTGDEVWSIKEYVRQKSDWVRDVESDREYIEYVFKAQPIISAYEEEMENSQKYLAEENEDLERRAIEQAEKRQRQLSASSSEQLKLGAPQQSLVVASQEEKAVVPMVKNRGMGTLTGYVVKSDAFARLHELESDYCELIGCPPPSSLNKPAEPLVEHCHTCHVEMIADTAQAMLTCPKCAVTRRLLDMSMKAVPFSHPINAPKSKGTYEKRTYKDKWKKMVSGQLNADIPDVDWTAIYKEAIRRGYRTIERKQTRRLLKDLDMVRYYDYTAVITNELNGVPLIHFSKDEEETIDTMFEEAVELFEKCPFEVKQRSSFISYSYFFHQVCLMAGFTHYLDYFPPLLGRENQKHHDRIWKWMCEHKEGEPKWVFHPTI